MSRSALILAVLWACPAPGAPSPATPLREWTPADFTALGRVVVGPVGDSHPQFLLRDGDRPTLLDLRRSSFLANEGGPFRPGHLPSAWPTGKTFEAVPELAGEEKYPISIHGTDRGIFVLGGRVFGVQPREIPWRIIKGRYDGDAVHIESAGEMVVEGLYAENVEDVFGPRGTGTWLARGIHARTIRDDFVENDGLLSGEIADCLVEGAHVLLSNRPGKAHNNGRDVPPGYRGPHVVIRDTLASMAPMPYDGDMKLTDQQYIVDGKAGGKLFKWCPAGGSVDVRRCLFRVDAMAATGPTSMGFPPGTYQDVTLIWLGKEPYPAPVPEGVRVVRDPAAWDAARDRWLQAHPSVSSTPEGSVGS